MERPYRTSRSTAYPLADGQGWSDVRAFGAGTEC